MIAVHRARSAQGRTIPGRRRRTGPATAVRGILLLITTGLLTSGAAVTDVAGANGDVFVQAGSDRPAVPIGVTDGAGAASITASWAPVAGATGYTVTAVPGPGTCDVFGADTSCLIGATADLTYTVTVVAHGPGGDSDPSADSDPVTALEPPAPPADPASVPQTLTTSNGKIAPATPGQKVTLEGSDFAPNSSVNLLAFSGPVDLGSVTTDRTGSFSVSVTIPADLDPGAHHLLAAGIDAGGGVHQMAVPITVAPTSASVAGPQTVVVTVPTPVPGRSSMKLPVLTPTKSGRITSFPASTTTRILTGKHRKEMPAPVIHFHVTDGPSRADSVRVRQ